MAQTNKSKRQHDAKMKRIAYRIDTLKAAQAFMRDHNRRTMSEADWQATTRKIAKEYGVTYVDLQDEIVSGV